MPAAENGFQIFNLHAKVHRKTKNTLFKSTFIQILSILKSEIKIIHCQLLENQNHLNNEVILNHFQNHF